jgi:hypothetical protein
MTDLMLVGFALVQSALFVPPDLPNQVILHDSPTNVLRRAFLIFLDILVLYYAISRSCNDRRKIIDAEAAFCLSTGIMALVAVFEHLRGWLMYQELALRWNPLDNYYTMAYLMRGESWLRTQASAGHALSLGIMLAIAFGFWLYLQSRVTTMRARLGINVIIWSGLIVAYSRGPWIGAVLIYLAYSALRPRAISRFFKTAFMVAVVLGLASLSPIADKIVSSLSLSAGRADPTFLYRQRLLDRSLELIQENPAFGDQLAMSKMGDLRQGQGIIDIVNTYVGVALFSGLVGLTFFLGFIWSAAMGAFRVAKASISLDPEWGLLGFNLLACIVGMLFMIADCSLILGVEKMLFVLIALAAAYARQGSQIRSGPTMPNSCQPNEDRPGKPAAKSV